MATIFLLLLLGIFAVVRVFSSYRLKPYVRSGMWITLLICFAVFALSFTSHIPNYANQATIEEEATYTVADKKIYIDLAESKYLEDGYITLGNVIANRDGVYGDNIRINVYKTEDKVITINKETSSRGASKAQARKIAAMTAIAEKVEENKILIPEVFRIKKGDKYRRQKIVYNIYIPEDKEVIIDRELRRQLFKNEFRKKRH
jgi:hypothetical protein